MQIEKMQSSIIESKNTAKFRMKIVKEESVKNSGRQRSWEKNKGVWDPNCQVKKKSVFRTRNCPLDLKT